MKKYQMPNVKEEKLESALFIMAGSSTDEQITLPPEINLAPRSL